MAQAPTQTELADAVVAGDLRALARAATMVENQTPAARQLIASLFPRTGNAMIIGITGPPGSGKSTLVDQLARLIRGQGRSVGIIAVDPSSPYTHGAILGDRIRMQDHHDDPGVFIRSMATRGRLGGLAQATLEMALLLDGAGRDVVLVETVGVGQDEVEIASLADVTVVVLVPGLGDDVQAIKAGIMEVADVFAINKSDLPGAERLEQEIRAMQSLGDDGERANAAPIRRVVATEARGLEDLLDTVKMVFEKRQHKGARTETWIVRLRELLRDSLLSGLPEQEIEFHAQRVAAKLEDPFAAVNSLRAAIGVRA